MTPSTSPNAAIEVGETNQNRVIPPTAQVACQLIAHRPVRVGPILFIIAGASHVASISDVAASVRRRPMLVVEKVGGLLGLVSRTERR